MAPDQHNDPPLLLYLIGGRELRLSIEPEKWSSAFHDALVKNEAIQIDDPSGEGKHGINPRAVLYWKVMPDSPGD
jgi:hypothetical protein